MQIMKKLKPTVPLLDAGNGVGLSEVQKQTNNQKGDN